MKYKSFLANTFRSSQLNCSHFAQAFRELIELAHFGSKLTPKRLLDGAFNALLVLDVIALHQSQLMGFILVTWGFLQCCVLLYTESTAKDPEDIIASYYNIYNLYVTRSNIYT